MGWRNDILAGEELIRTAMRSANFVPGVTGWRFARDGTFQLAGGLFIGDISVVGPNGRIDIYDDPTFGAIIKFTDQSGVEWMQRVTAFGTGHSWVIGGNSGSDSAALGIGFDTAGLNTGQFAGLDRFFFNCDIINVPQAVGGSMNATAGSSWPGSAGLKMRCFGQSVSFSGGNGTLSYGATFPNGVLGVFVFSNSGPTSPYFTLSSSAHGLSSCTVHCYQANAGFAFNGSLFVSGLVIGW